MHDLQTHIKGCLKYCYTQKLNIPASRNHYSEIWETMKWNLLIGGRDKAAPT